MSGIEASIAGMISELNTSGLTAFGSAGCDGDQVARYRPLGGCRGG